jgi:IS30 family transposase
MQHHLGSDLFKGGVCDPTEAIEAFSPRGTDLSGYSQEQLDQVSLLLNQRPRKTLGFQTPADKLQASVASTP